MSTYIKKRIEVEAVQLNSAGRFTEAPAWLTEAALRGQILYNEIGAVISTLEGTMQASAGDYVIRGVEGEIYPCKPDIFRKSYDEVPEYKDEAAR